MTRDGALSMFARLADRSVERIGEIAADPRRFDRGAIIRLADVWDNNTDALFGAAITPTRFLRERRARAGLRWMADFGQRRRTWMIEEGGPSMARLLGPPASDSPFRRDYRGEVYALPVPIDQVDLAADYDPSPATIGTFRVERAGPHLDAFVEFTAPRRYPTPEARQDPKIQINLSGVRTLKLTALETPGLEANVGPDEVTITLGGHSRLVARSAEVTFLDDPSWHLSHAGRSAALITPRDPAKPHPRPSPPRRPLPAAALVFCAAMLDIRSVRYAKRLGRVPFATHCATLANAGDRVLAAARSRRSEEAFEQLALDWIKGTGSMSRTHMTNLLPPGSRLRKAAEAARSPAVSGWAAEPAPCPPASASGADAASPFPGPAAVLRAVDLSTILTMVSWSPSGLAVNYATRAAAGDWSLHYSASGEPADLTLTEAAFAT